MPTGGLRRFTAAVAVLGACLALAIAVTGEWARRSVLDTDRFVDHVAALADDPAVRTALTDELTGQVMELVDTNAVMDSFSPAAAPIVGPSLRAAAQEVVHDRIATIVASDAFRDVLRAAVGPAHATAVRLVRGDVAGLAPDDRVVAVDLAPVVEELLAQLGPVDSGLLAVVEEARDQGVTLGTVVIDDDGRIAEARRVVQAVDRGTDVALVATAVLVGVALAVSDRRVRTAAELAVGAAATLAVVRWLVGAGGDAVADRPRSDLHRQVARAVVDELVVPFRDGTATAALLLAAVGVGLGVVVLVVGGLRRGPRRRVRPPAAA